MHINVPQTFSHKAIVFDKLHYFFMLSPDCPGKPLQKRNNLRPVPEIATRKFADDERMAHHPAPMQQGFQSDGSLPQMRHPNRSVNQDHVMTLPFFCGGSSPGCFSVPAKAASLLALSLAIKASRPSLTREVFSLMPVNSAALASNSSSMFRVVLMTSPRPDVFIICINMHIKHAICKGGLVTQVCGEAHFLGGRMAFFKVLLITCGGKHCRSANR